MPRATSSPCACAPSPTWAPTSRPSARRCPRVNMQKNLPSLYRTPVIAIATRCAFTNTVPIGPYRGAGRPEANYCMERLVDAAARETGRDPAALRRQQPDPAATPSPMRATSGLELRQRRLPGGARGRPRQGRLGGLRRAARGFCGARPAARARPRLLSRGHRTAQSRRWAASASRPDGRVTIVTGTLDYGQGHASAFAQVAGRRASACRSS